MIFLVIKSWSEQWEPLLDSKKQLLNGSIDANANGANRVTVAHRRRYVAASYFIFIRLHLKTTYVSYLNNNTVSQFINVHLR